MRRLQYFARGQKSKEYHARIFGLTAVAVASKVFRGAEVLFEAGRLVYTCQHHLSHFRVGPGWLRRTSQTRLEQKQDSHQPPANPRAPLRSQACCLRAYVLPNPLPPLVPAVFTPMASYALLDMLPFVRVLHLHNRTFELRMYIANLNISLCFVSLQARIVVVARV